MDPSFPADDEAFRELRAWLDGVSADDIDSISARDPATDAEVSEAVLRAFASDESCVFGWAGDGRVADFGVLAGWVPVPSLVVTAFGGVDAADDIVEITPIGSPGQLEGIRATWRTYDATSLTGALVMRTADGRDWTMVEATGRQFHVDIPTKYAQPIAGDADGGTRFEISVTAAIGPLKADIDAIATVDMFVRQWTAENTASSPRLVFRGAGAATWTTVDIGPERASALGIARKVELSRVGDEVIVRAEYVDTNAAVEASIDSSDWVLLHVDGRHLTGRLQAVRRDADVRLRLRPG